MKDSAIGAIAPFAEFRAPELGDPKQRPIWGRYPGSRGSEELQLRRLQGAHLQGARKEGGVSRPLGIHITWAATMACHGVKTGKQEKRGRDEKSRYASYLIIYIYIYIHLKVPYETSYYSRARVSLFHSSANVKSVSPAILRFAWVVTA